MKYNQFFSLENQILLIRGQKVMLDNHLALLYGVTTKRLKEQVRRNIDRFPEDFMFPLSIEEASFLRSQFAALDIGRGKYGKYRPYVFTEHGAVMLASVLNSKQAVQASIEVVRAFVRLRSLLAAHKEIAKKLETHIQDTNTNFKIVFELIKKHLPHQKRWDKIGFRTTPDSQ